MVDLKNQGKTIILSTHIFSLVEKLCDRVGIIFDGKMALDGSLKEMSKEKNVSISALMLSALTSDDNVNTFVQIGSRKIEYLTDSMSAKDLRLTPDERGYLMKF